MFKYVHLKTYMKNLFTSVDSDSSVASSTTSKGGRPRKKQPPRVNGRFSRASSVASIASNVSISSVEIVSPPTKPRGRPSKASQHNDSTISIEDNSGIISPEEQQERENEIIAQQLNEAQFKAPTLPAPRRSVRTIKAPEQYSDTSKIGHRGETLINKVTDHCRSQHKGYGCGSKEANHWPDYYDSVKDVKFYQIKYFIPF
jgi:hypothetical protein